MAHAITSSSRPVVSSMLIAIGCLIAIGLIVMVALTTQEASAVGTKPDGWSVTVDSVTARSLSDSLSDGP